MLELLLIAAAAAVVVRASRRPGEVGLKHPSEEDGARWKKLDATADRLFKQKNYPAAEKAYLDLLRLNHRYVTAYHRIGLIYVQNQNFGEAVDCFREVVKLEPGARSWHNLGVAQLQHKDYTDSAKSLNRALTLEPQNNVHVLALAKAYQGMGQIHKQTELLTRAAGLDPKNPTILISLAKAYQLDGDQAAAKRTYKRILALNPHHPTATQALTQVDKTNA